MDQRRHQQRQRETRQRQRRLQHRMRAEDPAIGARDSVTASVVSVATRPAPAAIVGRYCATLTATPTAIAVSTGRSRIGSLTARKTRAGDAPSAAAARE